STPEREEAEVPERSVVARSKTKTSPIAPALPAEPKKSDEIASLIEQLRAHPRDSEVLQRVGNTIIAQAHTLSDSHAALSIEREVSLAILGLDAESLATSAKKLERLSAR